MRALTAFFEIARLLGESEEWSPAGDYLESLAELVYAACFPHPGDGGTVTYYDGAMIVLEDGQ